MLNPKRIQVYHKCQVEEGKDRWAPPHRERYAEGFDTMEEAQAYIDEYLTKTEEPRVWVEHKLERQTIVTTKIGGPK